MISLDSARVSLLVCRANGTLGEGIVGVNPALLSAPEPAILCAHPGDPRSHSEAVHVHGFAEVPLGVLAIGQELAARLDLDRPNAAWHLGTSSVTVVRAEVVELELTVDAPVVAMADALSAQGQLAGRLLYASSAQQLGALSLAVGDDEYRVRYVRPAPVPDTDTLYQLDASTEVQLSSSGVRSPVDIVVLADCSRSMGVADVKARDSANGAITRLDAVKRGLEGLFEELIASTGRMARFALVSFADDCKLVFPALGGMAELDQAAPQQQRIELSQAIQRLRPKGDTHFGRALQFAGELLAKHSAPGNERLIVVISDGADWDSAAADDRDELMLSGVAAPLSLVESLSAQLGVRLHAIGISSRQNFKRFLRYMETSQGYAGRAHPSWVPNEDILRALMRVAGSDPERVGDADVLYEYFDQLDAGVSQRVSVGQPAGPPELTSGERLQLAEVERVNCREQLGREAQAAWRGCNTTAQSIIDVPLLLHRIPMVNEALNGQLFWAIDVVSRSHFRSWWGELDQVFKEGYDVKSFTIPGVRDVFDGERMRDLHQLRNWMSHLQTVPSRKSDLARTRKALQKLVGRPELADDDPADDEDEVWSRLQLALLTELHQIGLELATCLETAATAKAAGTYRPAAPELMAPEDQAPAPAAPTLVFVDAPRLQTWRQVRQERELQQARWDNG
jgi:hypothetical protein